MTTICYEPQNLRPATMATIDQANEIIEKYSGQGYVLTLRQLYYQFVSRDLIENTPKSYDRLVDVMTKARIGGLSSWTAIEDRGRSIDKPYVNESIEQIIASIRHHFAADFWKDQPRYIEVWVEKDALSSVVERACEAYRVPHLACKGYLSASEAWRSGQRMAAALRRGQSPLVLHLGDHDPSGIDMTRDNRDRLHLFADAYPGDIEVRRIALNRDQVDHYDPPPNPAKVTDSRAESYIDEHGYVSWELDALEPSVIEQLIKDEIAPEIDPDPWAEAKAREQEGEAKLTALSDHWDEVEEFLETLTDEG